MNLGERIGLLAVLVGVAGGCSSMRSEDDTYNTAILGLDADTGGGGGNGGSEMPVLTPTWACLEDPLVPVDREESRIQYRVPIVDFDSQPLNPRPVPELQVDVCDTATCDPPLPPCPTSPPPAARQQCASVTPLPGAVPVVYQIDLPYGFANGYLKLTAPNYAEMNYILGGPMIGAPEGGPLVVGLAIPVLTLAARANAYRDVGAVEGADATGGVLAVRTLDCERRIGNLSPMIPEGHRAAEVTVEAQPNAPPPPAVAWSVSGNNVFSRDDLLTDDRGVAGYLNTEIGALVVVAQSPVGITYPENGVTFRVRAGVITLAELRDGLGVWGQ